MAAKVQEENRDLVVEQTARVDVMPRQAPVSNDCRSSLQPWFVIIVLDCIADGKQFRACEDVCVCLQ